MCKIFKKFFIFLGGLFILVLFVGILDSDVSADYYGFFDKYNIFCD